MIVQNGAVGFADRILCVDAQQKVSADVLVITTGYDEIAAGRGAEAFGHLALIRVRPGRAASLQLTRRQALARALGVRGVAFVQDAIQAKLNVLLAGFAPLLGSLLARVLLHESDDDRGHVLLIVRILVFERDQKLRIRPVKGLAQATTTTACPAWYPIFIKQNNKMQIDSFFIDVTLNLEITIDHYRLLASR